MNRRSNIFAILISISFVMFSLLGSIHFCCFDENFYTKQHNKIQLYSKSISEHIGITDEELKELTHFTLKYLLNEDTSLDLKMNIKGIEREVFNDDEKAHMADVRSLNLWAMNIMFISLAILVISLIIFLINKYSISIVFNKYKKILFNALIIFTLIGLWILIDFDSFWTLFHHIFFAGNDLWLLDLRTDILIMIVPPEFFNNLVVRIVIIFILCILSFYLLLYLLNRKKKEYD